MLAGVSPKLFAFFLVEEKALLGMFLSSKQGLIVLFGVIILNLCVASTIPDREDTEVSLSRDQW